MQLMQPSDELAEHWTLLEGEHALLANKTSATRLGFAILLKFFGRHGRFPSGPSAVPADIVAYVARQVLVIPDAFRDFDWSGRTIKYHRAQIRTHFDFREATVQDGEELVTWLSARVTHPDPSHEALKERAYERLRDLHIEPPTVDRLRRLLHSAVTQCEMELHRITYTRLSAEMCAALDTLVRTDWDQPADQPVLQSTLFGAPSSFGELKDDAGAVRVDTVLAEVQKLHHLRALALPLDLFRDAPPKFIAHYHQRAATEPPRELRRHSPAVRYTLLSAFCHQRMEEITDNLVELLMAIAYKIGVRAETKVDKELLTHLRKVSGKTGLLFKLAEAAVKHPEGVVKQVLYPIVSEQTLRDLVQEHQASGPAYAHRVRTVMRASYSHHYRRVTPLLLDSLEFRSNNAAHQPVIRALEVIHSYQGRTTTTFPRAEQVPLDGVVRDEWRAFILEQDATGPPKINRIAYEMCVLTMLRDKLRSKEIWVVGARRFRNPADDIPRDFETRRAEYYQAMGQPTDAKQFVQQVRQDLEQALAALNAQMPTNPKAKILTSKQGKGRISISPLDPLPEPPTLHRLKLALVQHWPMTNLVDILKETELRVGFTEAFRGVGTREVLTRDVLQRRLLLALHGLGTNTGLKRVSSGGGTDSYADLLYVRRRYIHKEQLRSAIAKVCNAIFTVRNVQVWGEATTACASDSKQFGAWDQNLMTERHVRYGGRGIMIYWHVEQHSTCIYSQLKACSSSEVAAMIEGVLRHDTDMEVDKTYVDTHGQSEVGFAFCHLLGFQLLPRLKNMKKQKLYRPTTGMPEAYPNLQPILTRPINWELIEQQYDELVKYATAVRLGTADAESILRRFTRANVQHPTYKAFAELGKALKTTFLCDYIRLERLRREIHEGLQVIETWNSANTFILYGKGGEFASNQLEDQEITMLCLHLLQVSLVYINTLMLQQILAEPTWQNRLAEADIRALTPLLWGHVNPYGTFTLDMHQRLPLEQTAA